MADLKITVDVVSLVDAKKKLTAFQNQMGKTNSVVGLTRALGSVERNISELIKAQQKGQLSGKAFDKGLLEQRKALEAMGMSSYMARKRVEELANALRNQAAAQQAARAAQELARAQQQAAERTHQLRMQFQQGYAASQRARQQVRDLNDAYRQGLVNADQYRAALARIREEQRRGSAAAQGSTRGINGMGMVMQQTGYQVGDFLVQVQSGTNFMVAFGQQATQLAGILPLLGAGFLGLSMTSLVALSAGLGIAIPLITAIGAGIMRTNQAAKDAGDGIGSLSERVNNAVQSIGNMNRELEVTRRGLESVEQLDLIEGIEAQGREVERLQQRIERINSIITRLGGREQRGALVERLQAEEELLQLRKDQLEELNQLLALEKERDASEEITRRNQSVANTTRELQNQIRLSEIILQYGEDSAEVERERNLQARAALVTEQLRAGASAGQIAAMLELVRRAQELDGAIRDANAEAERLAALDVESGIAAAANSAAQLARSLGVSVSAASALMAMGGGRQQEVVFDPRDPRYDRNRAMMAQVQSETVYRDSWSPDVADTGGDGGGSRGPDAVERLQQEIAFRQRILNLSQDERNLQGEIYRITQALGDDRDKYSTAYIENLARQNIALQEQERVIEEATRRQNQLAESIAGSFGDALMSMVDGTKSAKEAFRTMAADIIKELYRVLVVQRLVNSVTSALSVGGGLGGFLGGLLGGRASGGTMMANSPYLVGEHGPEIVMPGRSGTVANADLTRKAMNGGETTVVNQTINISTGVQQTVRNEIKQLMPQIAESAKSAVLDAKRRGGSYGRAFN